MRPYKATQNFEQQHKQLINAAISRLNSSGKRVISISISQSGSLVPLYVALLWEKVSNNSQPPLEKDESSEFATDSFDDLPEL
jgi:hypothetical protein